MGLLRVLLALAVIIAHSNPILSFKLIGGEIAVQTFFIISGFYMSLILDEKYVAEGSYVLFLSNRLLRLYPMYWVVLLSTIFISTVTGLIFGDWLCLSAYIQWFGEMSWKALLLQIGTNLFLFGQDFVMFLGMDPSNGEIFFTSNFRNTNPQFWHFLLVPQAWSLAVELLFYIIAPVVVRRSTLFIVLSLVVSLLLRGYLYFYLSLNYDPWISRFFPIQLALFLAGVLSYRIYKIINSFTDWQPKAIVASIFVLVTFFYDFIPGYSYKMWLYYSLACLSLPFIFSLTRNSKLDRRLGELSYPMYIIHYLVIALISPQLYMLGMGEFLGLFSGGLSISVAAFLVKFISDPVERFRQARVISF